MSTLAKIRRWLPLMTDPELNDEGSLPAEEQEEFELPPFDPEQFVVARGGQDGS